MLFVRGNGTDAISLAIRLSKNLRKRKIRPMLYQDDDIIENEIEYERLCEAITGKGSEALVVKLHSGQQQLSGLSKLAHVHAVSELAALYADDFYTEADFTEQRYRKMTCKYAGLLHEAIEFGSFFEELVDVSDENSARIVAMLTSDRRLPRPKRLKLYLNQVGVASEAAQIVKLADLQHECHQLLELPGRLIKASARVISEWREEAIDLLLVMGKIQESIYLTPQLAKLKTNLVTLGHKLKNKKETS
jgi:hypothetical protein